VGNNTQVDRSALLGGIYAERGHLLSHHRMLGTSDPQLLAHYEALDTRITLDQRVLSPLERGIVWVALISTTREKDAAVHFERAAAAGMSNDAIGDAVAIAGACEAFEAMHFAQEHFDKWVPGNAAAQRYLRMFEAARGATDPATAEIAAVACHAVHRHRHGMRVHLACAFASGATREQVAEALACVLLHRGGPAMIDAVNCWEQAAPELNIPGPC
jgi:alkylhydroperoxidase/carboxymuconolactone decarboxylase family protein YurZ